MTPELLLAEDPITHELLASGWTQKELDAAIFFKWDPEQPFDVWTVTHPGQFRPKSIGLIKAYLALRWLYGDGPKPYRSQNEAWAYVANLRAAPVMDAGVRHIEAQRLRALRPRGRLSEGGSTLNELIANLATKPAHADETAAELWPHLIAALDELDLSPAERPNSSEPRKSVIEYDARQTSQTPEDRLRKTLSYSRFSAVVSVARNRTPSRQPG
jgi:hypothetical protein